MFSDPDEIPDPKLLKNIELKEIRDISSENVRINLTFIMNKSSWEGTRICKKKILNQSIL